MGKSITPEGKVKRKVKAILKAYEPYLYAHWPVQMGFGAPTLDCNGAIIGAAFAIETKAPGEKPTERQLGTMLDMHRAGIKIFLIDGEKYPYLPLQKWLALQFKRKP